MSFSIGVLTIEMAANVARLQSDMSQAKQVVSDSVKSMQAAVDMLKGAFIGLTGVASISAFKGIIEGVIQAKVELGRLAIQTGASVESLSAIAAVAKATGTSIIDVGSAMNKLQKNLATSTEDGKGAAAALKALGISFKDFQSLSADEQMLQLAKAMDKFQDGGGKSAAAMLLWGKAGAQLLPMLKELAEKNELVGKTTKESTNQALQYEKNMKALEAAGNSWKRQITDDMLPALVAITKAMADAKKEGAGLLGSLGAGIATLLTGDDQYKNNKDLVEQTEKLMNLQNGLDKLRANGYDASTKAYQSTVKQIDAIKAEISTTMAYRKELESVADAKNKAAAAKDSERNKNGQLNLKVPGTDYAVDNQGLTLLNTLKSKYEQLTGGVSEYYDALRKMAAMKQAVDPIVRREIEAQARLNDQFVAQKANIDSFTKAEEARQAAIELADQAFTDATRNMSQATKDYDFQISLVGKNAEQVTRLTAVRAIDLQQMKIEAELGNARGAGLISQEQFLSRLNVTQREANDLKAKQAELMKVEDQRRTDPSSGIDQATKDYIDKVRKMGDAWKGATASQMDGLENNLVEMLTKGKASWKDYFNSIIADSVRLNVIRPLMAQLMGAGGGAAGAAAGASGGGGMNWGGIVSGAAKLFGFAEGGNPPVGVPYMVGEKGPELRIDRTPGTIIPNDKLGAMGGGKAISLTNNITVAGGIGSAEAYTAIQKALAENNRQWTESLRRQGVLA